MRSTFFSLTVASTLMFAGLSQAADQSRFSSVIDDLPLMEHMVEADDSMTFTTPTGRIANVDTVVPAKRDEVLTFYAATLPQLGWAKTGPATFVREGEMLVVTFEQDGADLKVHFAISPSKK